MMSEGKKTTLSRVLGVVASIIFGIALVVCSVIGSFATFATDADYYREVQSGLGVTPSRLGLSSEENMMIANQSLADYMAGRIDDMQVIVENYGVISPDFTFPNASVIEAKLVSISASGSKYINDA